MDQLITLLKEKTGIDDATADKVAQFIKEHAHEIPQLLGKAGLGDVASKVMGGGPQGVNNPLGGVMDAAKGLLGDNKE